jgi:hypothetical protein
MLKLDLDLTELKERLFGITDTQEQWSVILDMYMEDYEKQHPELSSFVDMDEKEATGFMSKICSELVSNGTISRDSKTGGFIFPKINIFQ